MKQEQHNSYAVDPDQKLVNAIYQVLKESRESQELEEGPLAKGIAIATLIAQSAFGGFASDWSKYYQGTNNPVKTARAIKVLEKGYSVPSDARASIAIAAYIFAGDGGHSKSEIIEYLEKTGAVESGYKTKVQYGGGPARSYWQVEPKTAMSLVKHSHKLFGPKFKSQFGSNIVDLMSAWGEKEWSQALEMNDDLAAAMAAAKWISTPW